jgi:signal transduction histidine kinase
MGNEGRSSKRRKEPVLRVGSILSTLLLLLSGLLCLVGLLLLGHVQPLLLAVFLAVVLLYYSLMGWLKRHGVWDPIIRWGLDLGHLAFVTIAVYYSGGFASPFFMLYAICIVAGGLRGGWTGTLRGLGLCSVGWTVLAVLVPPAGLEQRAQLSMTLGTFLALALVVGALTQRHVGASKEALKRNQEIAFLQEAGRSLGSSLDPQRVLAATLAQVNEILDVEAASLALVDRETGFITFELAIGGGNDAVKGLRLEPGQGIVGKSIADGRAVLVSDVMSDPQWFGGVDKVSGYQTRSLMCVPLRVKGQVIGAVEVLNKRDGPFTDDDLRLVSSLGDLAAQAIENARLHDEIRRHVHNLQVAYEEVRKLDELKSAFIRNVSHELRTPLALIEGYTELLLDEQMGALEPEQLKALSLVADKASHLNRLVNDIISLQTIGAMGFDMVLLDMCALARRAAESLRPKADKAGIRLALEFLSAPEQLQVQGDARRLAQVLIHLLDNAVKFSPNGGQVTLTLERDAEMAVLRVVDEGIGLSRDQLERVFDRFYQVDGSATRYFGGTGLGLALVKEVVEAHGGAVWAESEGAPGRGCTFTLCLLAHDGDATA